MAETKRQRPREKSSEGVVRRVSGSDGRGAEIDAAFVQCGRQGSGRVMTGEDRRKLNKDAGFSLLELLIAVIILAIIVVPLLNLFLSSNRLNIRSRQTLRATTVAQDIMEGLKAYDIVELKAQFNNPTDGFYVIDDNLIKGVVREEPSMEVDEATGDPCEGLYYFSLSKVSMQGSEFDALIRVDAREYAEPGVHGNAYDGDPLVLNKAIADARSIDKKNGTFVETDEIRKAVLKSVWENEEMKDALEADGITQDMLCFKDQDRIFTGISRTIEIDLKKSSERDEEGNRMVDMSVTNRYEFVYQGVVFSTTGYAGSSVGEIEDRACGVVNGDKANINIFYFPLYGDNCFEDKIVVKNDTSPELDLELNLLIAKQIYNSDNPDDPEILTDAMLMAAEMGYVAEVEVRNGPYLYSPYMDKDKFTLKTNLGINLTSKTYMSSEGKDVNQPSQLYLNGTPMDLSGTSQMNIYTLDGVRSPMGAAPADGEITELFYNVEVSVYKEGAAGKGFPEEERMVVIGGSKNN